jgi:nucleoside-diphosphate-sugar epimerase
MRVLVTGGTSLLMRRTAETLSERGDHVVMLQRGRASSDAEQVLGDVRDPDIVRRATARCDAIVHGAAKVGVVGSWEEYRSINVDGTANVLDAALGAGVSRLVHVSTPSVAHTGTAIVGAGAEPAVTGRAGAFYAESKARAERLVLGVHRPDLPLVVIRPHLVWGPGDTQLVGRIVARARAGRLALVGTGAALVDTTYVDNGVAALVAALDAATPGAPCLGRPYVIANGEPRPIRDLVVGICRAAGLDPSPRHIPLRVAVAVGTVVEHVWTYRTKAGEPPLTRFLAEQLGTAHWFDPRPARDDLGYEPHVSIDEGLRRLAGWYSAGAPAG